MQRVEGGLPFRACARERAYDNCLRARKKNDKLTWFAQRGRKVFRRRRRKGIFMGDSRQGAEGYGADKIQVLEGMEAVRKRPAMYIGDTVERGYHTASTRSWTIRSTKAMAGYCRPRGDLAQRGRLLHGPDDGRGIPVDMHPPAQRVEVASPCCNAGGKLAPAATSSGGLHGVGVSCVNACPSDGGGGAAQRKVPHPLPRGMSPSRCMSWARRRRRARR